MNTSDIEDIPENWDNRRLGSEQAHAGVADPAHEAALDEALGMQSISIRLPQQLIEHYKLIAKYHGVGYQPLMRDVLQRWVPGALKEVFDNLQAKAEIASARATLVDLIEEPRRPGEDGDGGTGPDSPLRKAA